jgi:hypothetical protein
MQSTDLGMRNLDPRFKQPWLFIALGRAQGVRVKHEYPRIPECSIRTTL